MSKYLPSKKIKDSRTIKQTNNNHINKLRLLVQMKNIWLGHTTAHLFPGTES